MSSPDWDGVCDCPKANHRHGGKLTRAVHGCHCEACTEAGRAYKRETKASPGYVDAAPVRDHLLALRDAGMPQREVAARAGVGYGTLVDLSTGASAKCRAATAEAVLGVEYVDDASRYWRSAEPYTRRVQALACMGWTMPQVARAAGLGERTVRHLANGLTSSIQPRARRCIERAYRALSTRPAPDTARARSVGRMARQRGWVGPVELEDMERREDEA